MLSYLVKMIYKIHERIVGRNMRDERTIKLLRPLGKKGVPMEDILTLTGIALLWAGSFIVFTQVSRLAGALIFSFALVSAVITLSFHEVPGLTFIGDALTDFELVNGEAVQSNLGRALGILSSVTQVAMAVGLIMVALRAKKP